MFINKEGNYVEISSIKEKEIVFYGASTRNIVVIEQLGIQDNVLFYIDSNKDLIGEEKDGYKILRQDRILDCSNVIIISVLLKYKAEIIESMKEYDVDIFFYVPDYVRSFAHYNEIIMNNENRYKYLHIFPSAVFIKEFYFMSEKEFNIGEHLFLCDWIWYWGNDEFDILKYIFNKNTENNNIVSIYDFKGYSNSVSENNNCNSILKSTMIENVLESVDKIILHSAFWGDILVQFLAKAVKKYGNKMGWFCWGSDCLYEKDDFIVDKVLRKVKNAYAPIKFCEFINNRWDINVNESEVTYCYVNEKSKTSVSTDLGVTNILLGHSATKEVRHKYGLDILKRYCKENIKVYCPLSYGDKEYAKEVIEEGYMVFGNKFIPITVTEEVDEWYGFLSKIDIAVFPLERMMGATTLTYLNSIGKKIYVSEEMVEWFKGISIYADSIEVIKQQTFIDFIRNSNKQSENIIQKLNDKVVKCWENILNDN